MIKGRKRRRKRRQKFIIFFSVFFLLFLSVGYAAFNTNISINAKGNIKLISFSSSELLTDVVSSGDGLYQGDNDYYYKGENVNNNLLIDNEVWRIMSIENDGTLKIIKEEPLDQTMPWHDGSTTNSCSPINYTCIICEGIYYGSFTQSVDDILFTYDGNTSLNNYLNGTYYNGLSDDLKNIIVENVYDIGFCDTFTTGWADCYSDPYFTKINWTGKVGLIDVNEYIRSSSNENCVSSWLTISGSSVCTGSYLNSNSGSTKIIWTINSSMSDGTRGGAFYFRDNGHGLFYGNVQTQLYVRPTLYLSSEIKLIGEGTTDNPYKLS